MKFPIIRMKRICFCGGCHSRPERIYSGIPRVMLCMDQYFTEKGCEVFYYCLYSREDYRRLNGFLIDNRIDVVVWHMATLKIKGRLRLPCPLVCLWHSSPNLTYHNHFLTISEKYGIPGVVKHLFRWPLTNRIFDGLHRAYCATAFLYLTARADKFVLLSNYYKPVFLPAKVFPNKVTAICNMLPELSKFANTVKKNMEVTFVGRLDNRTKQVNLLLEIWKKVEGRVDDWILNICGTGPDEKELRELAESLGLERCFFRGFVNPAEYYARSSIVCLTSAKEGFPMVLLEAMQEECVPVVFDSFESYADLIIPGETGCVVPSFDVDKYADTLVELMSDNEKLKTMGEKARKHVMDNFSVEKIMGQWEGLLDEVCSKHKNSNVSRKTSHVGS